MVVDDNDNDDDHYAINNLCNSFDPEDEGRQDVPSTC
jgi:hypothetical protein